MANRIGAFFHCRQCMEERPATISPREWSRIEVGWTPQGLQVWCVRHDCNIFDLDFQGQQAVQLPDDYDPRRRDH